MERKTITMATKQPHFASLKKKKLKKLDFHYKSIYYKTNY